MGRDESYKQCGASRGDIGFAKEPTARELVANLEQIETDFAARALLDRVDPNYVVWLAGTGCRGRRTIDSEKLKRSVKQMIVASISLPKVSKFLMASYLSNRRKKRDAPITDEQWDSIANANENEIPIYTYDLEAEEFLNSMAAWRRRQTHLPRGFQSLQVTTSSLSDAQGTGSMALHSETVDMEGVKEEVSRQDVAEVIVCSCWRDPTRRDGIVCCTAWRALRARYIRQFKAKRGWLQAECIRM